MDFSASLMVAENDTLFLKKDTSATRYFWTLENGIDYKVSLPLASKNFEITGTEKGPDADTFVVEGSCGLNDFEVLTFINTHIDGKLIYPVTLQFDSLSRYLFLIK